jgi:hypothetical protein
VGCNSSVLTHVTTIRLDAPMRVSASRAAHKLRGLPAAVCLGDADAATNLDRRAKAQVTSLPPELHDSTAIESILSGYTRRRIVLRDKKEMKDLLLGDPLVTNVCRSLSTEDRQECESCSQKVVGRLWNNGPKQAFREAWPWCSDLSR